MSFVWNYITFLYFPFQSFYFLFTVSILAITQLHYSSALRITMATRLIQIPFATIRMDLFVSNSFFINLTDYQTSTKFFPSKVFNFTTCSAILYQFQIIKISSGNLIYYLSLNIQYIQSFKFHPESPSDSSNILSPIADLKLGSILLQIISFSSKLSAQNRLGPLITILSTPKSIPDIIIKLNMVKFSKVTTFLSKMISIRVQIAIEINKRYGSSQISPTKNIIADIRYIILFLEMSRKDMREKRGGFINVRPNMMLKQSLFGYVVNIFNLMANVKIINMLTKPKSDEVYELFVTFTMGFSIFSSLMAYG